MKALTIWQPWASLIMEGAKIYEFRRWAAPKSLHGQRIVIHAGSRPMRKTELQAIQLDLERTGGKESGLVTTAALDLLERAWRNPTALPLATGLGTVTLGVPQRAKYLFGHGDDDRINPQVWAWPVTDIQPFETPIAAKGAQGFWNWKD